jgi:hypothetical protein
MATASVLVVGGGLMASRALAATTEINASRIASGQTQSINWAAAAALPKLPCGPCTYAASATAMINPDLAPALYPHAWPAAPQATLPNPPPVASELETPQGEFNGDYEQVYVQPFWRRGAVDFDLVDRAVSSLVWKTGTASATVAYHVKVSNDGAVARDYFVELAVPDVSQAISYACSLVPGDNGGTYLYHRQKYGFGRSLVELLVDGLPVWSNTASYHFPEDFDGAYFKNIQIAWGDTDTDRIRLYLGKLAPGAAMTIDYSVRTDSRADSSTCGKESHSWPAGSQTDIRCYTLRQQRALPTAGRGVMAPMDFQVYVKELGGAQ